MPIDAPPTVETVLVRQIRLPRPAGDAAFSIIRLDHKALQLSPRLDESLRAVPSFSMYRRNSSYSANPTTQGVALRAIAGSAASRALVTLDGVPLNDPFGGWVIWSAIPSDLIGAADVVRGAGAGPYGAGALTGTISLSEDDAVPGGVAADVSGGSLGDVEGQAVVSRQAGPVGVLLSGAGESSDGFIPVRGGRGPVDTPLDLHDWSGSGRFTADAGPGALGLRLSAYQEDRGGGVVGSVSRARGQLASLSYAQAPTPNGYGYRLQAWVSHSDLLYASTSVLSLNRQTATPADDQYATPAIGYGFNGAVRRDGPHYSWEVGADMRVDQGQSEEDYSYLAGGFTRSRVAGGQAFVGGLYAEGEHDFGPWVLTGGVRLDGWGETDGHRIERLISTGAITYDQHPPDRGGTEPTARLGLRRNFAGGYYVRTATYAGFRPVSLNELYRPYRVGNDLVESNPALKPEKLYGAEVGLGADGAWGGWSATGFVNQLRDAVINTTIAHGPVSDPFDPVGNSVKAGGTLYQRRNTHFIDARGFEAETHRDLLPNLVGRIAADYTDAVVDGGAGAPQLTGRRPAETPKFAATAGLDWRAIDRLMLSADARYESLRYDDDQNTRPIKPGLTVDARAEVKIAANLVGYVVVDNVFNAPIQTGRTATNVVSYDAPRTFRVGLAWRR